MKLIMATTAGLLTLNLAACEQPGTTVSNNVAQADQVIPDEPGVANLPDSNLASGAPMPMEAQQFAATLAGSDLFEIASGRMAAEKGSLATVRSMGAMIAEDHRKASEEMKVAVANGLNQVRLPTAPPPELQAKLDALQGLSGAEFDRRWLAEQVAAHQQTLTAINGFLAGAEPSLLKDHAAKATGIIQQHLRQLNEAAR